MYPLWAEFPLIWAKLYTSFRQGTKYDHLEESQTWWECPALQAAVRLTVSSAPSHCWLTATLWPNATDKHLFRSFCFQVIAPSPQQKFLYLAPTYIILFCPVVFLTLCFIVTLWPLNFFHPITRYSSVSTGSAAIISPTASAGRFPALAQPEQLLLPKEFHQQCPSSLMVFQHNTPHCLLFGLCLNVLTFLY